MKKVLGTMFLVLALTLAVAAQSSQSSLRIAADSSSGTYGDNLGQLIDKCSDKSLDITPLVGNPPGSNGGAVGNLDALVNNKADAAFMHSDVYLYNAQADPTYNKFKTLIAFWPEPIHVVVLAQTKTYRQQKKASFCVYNCIENVPVTFNNLSDLNGFSVGAAGGGVLTSRILSSQGGGNFTVVDAGSGKEVFAKLDSNEVQAAIFVGAAPLPNLANVQRSGKYRIITIGESISNRVANVYRPVKVNYPGMTNGPVATLAPLATLMTKQFNTAAKTTAQKKLRACVAAKLGDLQDNGSPNWQDVTLGDKGIGSIPWLEVK